MITNTVQDLVPAHFADDSRVWIFQSNRPFNDKEELEINEQLSQFYQQWDSHGTPVKGWAKLLFRQFIVVLADETATGVSGCSTDSMVRVVKSIERQYIVNLFDRMTLTFLVNDKAQMLPLGQVQYALDKGYIQPETLLFNNTVQTKDALLREWQVPLKNSWLANRVTF